MDRFIGFFKRVYVFLIFLTLEALAISYYAKSSDYTRAKLLTASNVVVGSINSVFFDFRDYLSLRQKNQDLVTEIIRLNNHISSLELLVDDKIHQVNQEIAPYYYSLAHVVGNSINKQRNYITLDKGLREGLAGNMAVVTAEGYMVGYVISCSDKYSVAISVLNTTFKNSGKVKGQDYFGSLSWDGLDYRYVRLRELPKYVDIKQGDTIVTTGYSSIFPKGITIGTVESFENEGATHLNVKVKLAANMASLSDVMIINFHDYAEIEMLEKNTTKK